MRVKYNNNNSTPMQMKPQHMIDQYTIIRKNIGDGATSEVALAQCGGIKYAIKVLRPQSHSSLDIEYSILRLLNTNCPTACIPKIYECCQEAMEKCEDGTVKPAKIMVMEYFEGGMLLQYINTGKRFTEQLVRTIFQMLLETIQSIHKQGYFHGDIKIQNIVVGLDGKPCIVDFGYAKKYVQGERNKKMIGSYYCNAPQIRDKDYDGKQVDLFSLGFILFVMYCRSYPYVITEAEIGSNIIIPQNYKIFLLDKEVFWNSFKNYLLLNTYSPQFTNLIDKMLALKPQDRLTIEQIKDHPWYQLTKPLDSKQLQQEMEARRMKGKQDKTKIKQGRRTRQPRHRSITPYDKYIADIKFNEQLIPQVSRVEDLDFEVDSNAIMLVAKLKFMLDCQNIENAYKLDLEGIVTMGDTLHVITNEASAEIAIIRKEAGVRIGCMYIRLSEVKQQGNLLLDFKYDRAKTDSLWFYALRQFIIENLPQID